MHDVNLKPCNSGGFPAQAQHSDIVEGQVYIMPVDAPDKEEIDELAEALDELRTRVNNYRTRAGAIDDEFRSAQERDDYGLDAVPYGEEMIRSREFPRDLRRAQGIVHAVTSEGTTSQQARALFDEAVNILENVTGTMEEFSDLPPL